MKTLSRLALTAISAPLLLSLAACGSNEIEGDAIDPIAAPEGSTWNGTATVTDLGGIMVGNPDAPVKLVEYASHTCSACANFAADSTALDSYIESGVVSFEMRNQVHDPIDLTVATLVRCGDPVTAVPLAKQVWQNLNSVIQNAQANGERLQAAMELEDDSRFLAIGQESGLLEFFAQRGISVDQATQCLSNPEVPRSIVENSAIQSDELGVTGTPTFFLNGNKLDGTSWAVVETALQTAGAR